MKRFLFVLVAFSALFFSCNLGNEDKTVRVTGISFSKSSLEISVGESVAVGVLVSPSDATNPKITYSVFKI